MTVLRSALTGIAVLLAGLATGVQAAHPLNGIKLKLGTSVGISDHVGVSICQRFEEIDGESSQSTEAAVSVKALKHLDVAVAYRSEHTLEDDEIDREHRPFASLTPHLKVGSFSFEDQNKFEWRIRQGRSTLSRTDCPVPP